MIGEAADGYGAALSGADYGEAYLEDTRWTSARLEDGQARDVGAGSERGLGLRLLRKSGSNVETLFGSAQDLGAAAARRLRERLSPGGGRGPAFAAPRAASRACRLDPADVSLEIKLELLREVDRAARAMSP
ncbi:MAG: hypothetical protein M0D55_20320 [Elusimicrobiota bacterium]|nr:MAG: hypothetical protein M0D55_20320 [Elusimicrobiota bacterium]